MKTKTIKLEPGEYTNFTTEFDEHDVILFNGARGSGKSYPVAKEISRLLEENENAKFIYMRISKQELATFGGWCRGLNLEKISGCEKVKLERGKPTAGDIMLRGYDEEDLLVYERVIGKCVSLESSALIKSDNYDEFVAIVFEEYARLKMNPNNERTYVFNFMEALETVFRERKKRVYCICNNFNTIPLLDSLVDELTGTKIDNPLKIKIFRNGNKDNPFLAYLNGEVYDDDEFEVNVNEFFILYTNKDYVIKQHMVYNKKYYITENKANKKITYSEPEYLMLCNFCKLSSVNEFYYQNSKVETQFIRNYQKILREITRFLAENGSRFIVPY